jgi:hypothetical protein
VTLTGPVSQIAAFTLNMGMLSLNIAGQGTVTPNYNGQTLQIGKHFKTTAKAAPGFVLSNWTGGVLPASAVITNSAKLDFAMQSNLVIQANFVPNPFIPLKGLFNGLFAEGGGVHHTSSGFLSISLTDRGTYTGSIIIAGTRSSLSGQFDLAGNSTKLIPSSSGNPSTLTLSLDMTPAGNQITGSISNTSWLADLLAFRAGFESHTNPVTSFAPKYTFVIPGVDGDVARPAGNGYASLTVDAGGKVTLTGALGDGTTVRQTVVLSCGGAFPFYMPLYGGLGSIFGWMSLTNRDSDDLHGQLTWTKPPGSTALYPLGFTNTSISASGSVYTVPAVSTRVLNLTNGAAVFTGGNLSSPFTNSIALAVNNKITNNGTNSLTLAVSTSNGLVTGTVTPPAVAKGLSVKGVILQKQNSASGFCLGTSQSSRFLLVPSP